MELKLTIDDGETVDVRNFALLPMVTSNKFTYATADGTAITIELKRRPDRFAEHRDTLLWLNEVLGQP